MRGHGHDGQLLGDELFFSHGSPGRPGTGARVPAPADRSHLEPRIDLGKVFDLTLPLDQAAEARKAMDEPRAIKALLQP